MNKIALNNYRPVTIKELINQINEMQPKKFRKHICEDFLLKKKVKEKHSREAFTLKIKYWHFKPNCRII